MTARQAHEAGDTDAKATALQAEFMSGMQSIVASNVAMDAFYATVKDHIDLPAELTQTWREKGTARYKQIAEVLRRAFPVSEEAAHSIRKILNQNASFRNRAIHPPAGTQAPVHHPELGINTEWRFVAFRFYNAKGIARLTLSIIVQLCRRPHKEKFESLRKYCEGLDARLSPYVDEWEAKYGPLYDKSNKNS